MLETIIAVSVVSVIFVVIVSYVLSKWLGI